MLHRLIWFECLIMAKYNAHKLKINAQKNERSHNYRIFWPTINVVQQTWIVIIKRGYAYNNDSIEFITFSLYLALNTCRDKGIQSFLIIPDIEQKKSCVVN